MLVFKLSWLPYMLIFAGILITIDGDPAALILVVIGAAWLFFKFKNKRAENAANNPNPVNAPYSAPNTPHSPPNMPYSAPNVPYTPPIVSQPDAPADANKTAAKFCSNCGTKVTPGSVFCSNCGNKL